MKPRTPSIYSFFFFNDTATTEIYTLPLHDALPICSACERTSRDKRSGCNRAMAHCILLRVAQFGERLPSRRIHKNRIERKPLLAAIFRRKLAFDGSERSNLAVVRADEMQRANKAATS